MPSGELFEFDVTGPPYYLLHRSELGEFWLSSDAAVPTFYWLAPIIDQIPEAEREAFDHLDNTIGGKIVFPAIRVGGKQTINGARAFHPRIKDRFDLTVECIRRHYLDDPSPLSGVLARESDFFGLFEDFARYVDFFHLKDLVNEDLSTVKFFTPFEDFTGSPVPATIDAYLDYRQRAIEFIESRNRRIAAYIDENPLDSIRRPVWASQRLRRCSRTLNPSDNATSWRRCSRQAIGSASTRGPT